MTNKRLPIQKTYKLFIGGKFPRTESGRAITLENLSGPPVNICRASRKDFRNAVTAARKAFGTWSHRSAYNRGQILYRLAEMMEGRKQQLMEEIAKLPESSPEAEVDHAIDTAVYYAGWADKYTQIFSSVNPVNSPHFNFSIPEPVGVIAMIAPQTPSLSGWIDTILPAITGGNTVITLGSEKNPLPVLTLAEILATSDLDAGVVNILSGFREELLLPMASHMDVNAVAFSDLSQEEVKSVSLEALKNMKRVCPLTLVEQDPYRIQAFQETKTTWHPIGI